MPSERHTRRNLTSTFQVLRSSGRYVQPLHPSSSTGLSAKEEFLEGDVSVLLWLKEGCDLGRTSVSVSCTPIPAHTALMWGEIRRSLRSRQEKAGITQEAASERVAGFAWGGWRRNTQLVTRSNCWRDQILL